MERFVVGISGASGIILAYRAIRVLLSEGFHVDLVVTRDANLTAALEVDAPWDTIGGFIKTLPEQYQERLVVYKPTDFSAPIASGSYVTRGMIIIPCSMATLAAVACGLSDNLLRRAADVTLKERRSLVVLPREMPLSEVHIENMLKVTRMGGVMVPPVPGWYSGHKTLEDVENFIVGRCLDALGIHTSIYPRWDETREAAKVQS